MAIPSFARIFRVVLLFLEHNVVPHLKLSARGILARTPAGLSGVSARSLISVGVRLTGYWFQIIRGSEPVQWIGFMIQLLTVALRCSAIFLLIRK